VHACFHRLQGSIMIPDKKRTKLRIAQAYVKLLCTAEGSSEASLSLTWIRNCEIRMFGGPQPDPDSIVLFWLELFDHGANISVDSFGCREPEDAVVVFEDFIAQAGRLNEAAAPVGTETQN
jgi:hypothetical protein